MVAIGGLGYVTPRSTSGTGPSKGSTGFRVGGERAAVAAGAANPISMSGLLGLQEAGTEAVQDREARRNAEDVLDALREMQRDLLAGGGTESLERAAAVASHAKDAADPRLLAVQRALLLRVAVERARTRPNVSL